MNPVLIIMLIFAILLKVAPPKKPNYYFGYQLGNAKKSVEHWKIANQYAANCMIIIYSIILALSIIAEYKNYDWGIPILILFLVGFVLMYWLVEKRLKKIDNATSGNTR
ncbi:MAG: SdpI family protein [Flavobacterium sp.]|nr:MAG: SdpI family protein [Flavobacterium sp.]